MEAIQPVTAIAARILDIEGEAGTFEVGRRTDLIAVARDPCETSPRLWTFGLS